MLNIYLLNEGTERQTVGTARMGTNAGTGLSGNQREISVSSVLGGSGVSRQREGHLVIQAMPAACARRLEGKLNAHRYPAGDVLRKEAGWEATGMMETVPSGAPAEGGDAVLSSSQLQ